MNAALVSATPPRWSGESKAQHGRRALRWRSWAADPTPDTWFATDDEYRKWLKWTRSADFGLRDLADMPDFNEATQQGRGVFGLRCVTEYVVRLGARALPECVDHGAMNAVNADRTIWRCLACGRGCFYVRDDVIV